MLWTEAFTAYQTTQTFPGRITEQTKEEYEQVVAHRKTVAHRTFNTNKARNERESKDYRKKTPAAVKTTRYLEARDIPRTGASAHICGHFYDQTPPPSPGKPDTRAGRRTEPVTPTASPTSAQDTSPVQQTQSPTGANTGHGTKPNETFIFSRTISRCSSDTRYS